MLELNLVENISFIGRSTDVLVFNSSFVIVITGDYYERG